MPIVQTIVDELEREAPTTGRVLERIPTDKMDWQPHLKSKSVGDLAYHIAALPRLGILVLQQDELDPSKGRPPFLVRQRRGQRADGLGGVAIVADGLGDLPQLPRLQRGLEVFQFIDEVPAAAARGEVPLQRRALGERLGAVQVIGKRRLVVMAVQRVLSLASLR